MKIADNVIVEENIDIKDCIVYVNTVNESYRGEDMPEIQNITEQLIGNIVITQKRVEGNLQKLNVFVNFKQRASATSLCDIFYLLLKITDHSIQSNQISLFFKSRKKN